jgi:hypothetical protein
MSGHVELHRTGRECPQCDQVDQVATVPAICDAGTSSYEGRSDGVSFGIGLGRGGVASGCGVSRSVGWQSGTIQTAGPAGHRAVRNLEITGSEEAPRG